jgi:hypothetical protein
MDAHSALLKTTKLGEAMMASGTVNQFIDWSSEFHTPSWQANDGIAVDPGTTTAFDVLSAVDVTPPLTVEHEGTGDGVFITSIDGVKANQDGNGYWWVYFVNGTMPDIGPAAYKVKSGDSIAWDYKHYSSGLKQATHPPLS